MIFIDTTYLLGLVNDKDQWHKQALKLAPKVEVSPKVISNIIIIETLNGLTGLLNGKEIEKLYYILNDVYLVYNETKEIYEKALEISKKYDGTIGYSDCTNIAIMDALGIYEIVSFDEHFDDKEGIVRIH